MHIASMFVPEIAQAFEAAKALPRWQRGWMVMQPCKAVILRHGWQVLGFCLIVSALLRLLQPSIPFWEQVIYSLPMGLITWALIDGGRFFIDQDSPHLFPRGWLGGSLILSSVLTGFMLGTLIGDAFHGRSSFDLMRRSPEVFAYIFLFSMAAGIGISVYFYTQGKNAYFQAELEAKSRQATEAQLKLLQSQLDPHMLFNTLANLRALIPQEPERAVQMLDQLGDFLRATLSASRAQEHSLAAEFDRLQDYLSLMKIRLGERLHYELILPSELAQLKVPSLILQSLVENAVLHGLEPKVGGGQVMIRASSDVGQLVLEVIDDGMGLDSNSQSSAASSGFGLAQVRERLKSQYGDLATIDLVANKSIHMRANHDFSSQKSAAAHSATNTSGCQATLRLPMQTHAS